MILNLRVSQKKKILNKKKYFKTVVLYRTALLVQNFLSGAMACYQTLDAKTHPTYMARFIWQLLVPQIYVKAKKMKVAHRSLESQF